MTTNASVDVVVIGAGVSGLASALHIARRGRSVAVVEQHRRAGMETSTHNSAVVHAGLYYPLGTLKAQLCVDGAPRLYEFCRTYGVPHERCGKLVVASDDSEVAGLEALLALGTAAGAAELEIVGPDFVRRREPRVHAAAALWSPGSGRLEAETLVRTLQRLAQDAGAIVLHGTRVLGGGCGSDGLFDVRLEREAISARAVVNAGGLYADDIAASLGGESFRIHPCRGEYAELKASRRDWVNGLVYPLPHASGHGLGVHLTRTTGGAVLLGPTIRFQDRKDDYEGDRLPLEAFLASTQRLLPGVTLDDLTYGGSGIRPKLHPASERFADFLIRADTQVPSLIHAAGIDSPGLTACLVIGERVAGLVEGVLA